MLTVRWTTLGPPITPRVSPVRGVGNVRVTAEDVERFGDSILDEDLEVLLERVMDDPEARYHIAGPAPKEASPAEDRTERQAQSGATVGPKRGGKRSWLAALFGK